MAGLVRGFADLMDGDDNSRLATATTTPFQSNPNVNNPVPFQVPAGFLNGANQKLLGVSNNTNIKVKGDRNGSLNLGS